MTARRATTPARAIWLIARLRLQRLANMVTRFRFGPKKPGSRPATPAKQRIGWVLSALLAMAMLLSVLNVSRQSMLNMQCFLAPASACLQVRHNGEPARVNLDAAADELHAGPLAPPVRAALTLQLSLLFLVSVMLPLSSRAIAAADWDLEWLVTLPARRATLLRARVFERTLVNPTGWILLAPCCTMLAWYAGFRWSAAWIGAAGALLLLPLAAMLRTLADTGLRMSLAPSQLRNVQAVMAVVGLPFMYLAYAFGTMHAGSPILAIARSAPPWMLWTPPGLLLRTIDAATPSEALARLALLLLELAAPLWAGMHLLRYQLRHGVVAAGARESARSTPRTAPAGRFARLLPASPIKRRELRLLSRDRNFLIQSLLLPLIIVGSQLLLTGSPDALAEIASSPKFMAGMAFGIGSYMLLLSAFQTLNNEGQSLWMLYTFPRSLESVLKEKAQFWAALALVYPLLILGAALWFAPGMAAATLSRFAMVLAGVPIFAVIAVALGVFACDPLAEDARNKIKPSYSYLYMMLSGLYIYAVSADLWSHKLVLLVLMASLAAALWQKARDQLPYLLDPAVAPPARVSTADGLIAAMLFFVLQGAILLAFTALAKVPPGEALVVAFSASGVLVYATMRLVYWLGKTGGVPAMLAGPPAAALGWALGGGAAAAAFALGYLHLIARWQLFPDAFGAAGKLEGYLLFLLAVVAAPLCEEFIFRGLVFGGLRRSMGLVPSMLMSSALFSIIHPAASVLPVFVLGLCTAYVYDKTRALLAPVLVHALYNAVVLVQ